MNPILIALIAAGALALLMATKKKAFAEGTDVNPDSPYGEKGGSSYDPNAPEGTPPPPEPKKKVKRYGTTIVFNPLRDKLKGLTAKEGSMSAARHTARHFGLHTRPLPTLPAEGDTDAWFALYNGENFDDLSESVRVAMRAVTRNVTTLLENNRYMRALGVYVPAWTPELSTAGGIGAAGQAALIQLAMDKRRKAAAEAPELYRADQAIKQEPLWDDKAYREAWVKTTTEAERTALRATVPSLKRDPAKADIMNQWRARTEIRPLEAVMMTIMSEALIAAVPNHTYDIRARQGEIDSVGNALWGQMRGAHERGETQLLFSEMFENERKIVREKVKTLWNEAAAAIDNPDLLPNWGDISHVLRDRVVAGMLLNVLRGEAIYGGYGPRVGVFGLQDFIQEYIRRSVSQEMDRLLSEFPELSLEEARNQASDRFGLSGLSADAIGDGADVVGDWKEYVEFTL